MKSKIEKINPNPIIGSEAVKHEPAVEPGKEPEKKFRIYAKRLFLTYSRTNLLPSEVLAQLSLKFEHIEKYVISQEDHADEPEKGKHIHVYLEFDRKVNILSFSFLDLEESDGNGFKKNIHGDYQPVKNKNHVIKYVKKDGSFISNFDTESEFQIKLFLLAKEKGLTAALNFFVEQRPELVASQFTKTYSNLKAFIDTNVSKVKPRFSDFEYPEDLLNWFETEKDQKTLFLTGPSGTGKTEGLINLLKDFNPILITEINALKYLTDENKAIIFDDLDWSNISRETKIHLFDKDRLSNIKIIYQSVSLKPDVIKAIISNRSYDLLGDKDEAISRRLRHVRVTKPIFNQINNITFNIFKTDK